MVRRRRRSARARVAIENAPRARQSFHLVRLLLLPLGLRREELVHIPERIVVGDDAECRRSRPSRPVVVRLLAVRSSAFSWDRRFSTKKACVNGSSTLIGDCGTSMGAGASKGSAPLLSVPSTS